jgi:O-acetyl-ADP-ribose deacetylase (regulator of RNase III)
MIKTMQGDIVKAEAEALVNTVNCVGIAGRGVALEFKRSFKENFKQYVAACKRKEVQPGRMFVTETGHVTFPRYIINFPTKRHWRGKSRIEDIEAGLVDLVKTVKRLDIRSIAVPPLGSGLGGLRWATVRPKIVEAFKTLPSVSLQLYEPWDKKGEHKKPMKAQAPPMTAGRAGLVGLMNRYLNGLLDPFISLLEVHKLMYFLQEAGEPLNLRYTKGIYGPFAENLRHVLMHVEGYYVSGYNGEGDSPETLLEIVPGAVQDAEEVLQGLPNTQQRFKKVDELVDGFESPFGLELLSTVHWVAKHEGVGNKANVASQVYAWNDRKKQFTPQQIDLAWDVLSSKGWI